MMKSLAVFSIFCGIFVALAGGQATDNIPQLASRLGLTTLVDKVVEADLATALSGPGPFTVFGPTNAAFESTQSFGSSLSNFLLYHVVSARILSSDLADEQTVATMSGRTARVNLYPKGDNPLQVATVQCAPIDLALVDQMASNGIIHVINTTMTPQTGNILEFVGSSPTFSMLVGFATSVGLGVTLSGDQPLTLFAPTDDAFNKLPAEEVARLQASPEALKNVLLGHVVLGTYCSAGLTFGSVQTVAGTNVLVDVSSDGVVVGGANVIQADGSVSNGVVHVIDSVLLP